MMHQWQMCMSLKCDISRVQIVLYPSRDVLFLTVYVGFKYTGNSELSLLFYIAFLCTVTCQNKDGKQTDSQTSRKGPGLPEVSRFKENAQRQALIRQKRVRTSICPFLS